MLLNYAGAGAYDQIADMHFMRFMHVRMGPLKVVARDSNQLGRGLKLPSNRFSTNTVKGRYGRYYNTCTYDMFRSVSRLFWDI